MFKHLLIITIFLHLTLSEKAYEKVGLKVKINNSNAVSLNRYFQTVMPGGTISFEIIASNSEEIIVTGNSGEIIQVDKVKWKFIAPQKSGNYEIVISNKLSNQSIVITIFVLTPLSKMNGEYLNDYRIGKYPKEKFKGKKNYQKPKGLIEVTEENGNIYISPHFRLKQFLCKQSSGWPKYLLVNPKLILKLEYLVNGLIELGINVNTLFIMSGYRTPYYNKSIGNVQYSRHVFGDAADVYVDVNMDGVIDDLNGDGKKNMDDALVIYSIINNLEDNPENSSLIGGMGKYKKTSAHTYFIHVDTRGYKARW